MEWIFSPLYDPIDSIRSPALLRSGSSFLSHST
jgi:hypothetical protein